MRPPADLHNRLCQSAAGFLSSVQLYKIALLQGGISGGDAVHQAVGWKPENSSQLAASSGRFSGGLAGRFRCKDHRPETLALEPELFCMGVRRGLGGIGEHPEGRTEKRCTRTVSVPFHSAS